MADLQKYFIAFHDKIKLNNYDENEDLREKRDIILKKLKNGLEAIFKDEDEKAPTYTKFDQGSYAMGTGVKPVNGGGYDIDVGLKFDISKDDYQPVNQMKKWVYEALKTHTKKVELRRSCVTVFYQEEGEEKFHVDLAIYAANNSDRKIYIAKGKLHSKEEEKKWEVATPEEFKDVVKSKFEDAGDRAQFRRTIQYLKRWKDLNFSDKGNAAPIGIGITVLAYYLFQTSKVLVDIFANKYSYDDLKAISNFVKAIVNSFSNKKLVILLPTEPWNDLFKRMSDIQMENFKSKLETLNDILVKATEEVDPVEACTLLRKVFGDDFPVPKKEETRKKTSLAFTTSSESA